MPNDNITPAALSALAKGDMKNFLTASTPGGIEASEAAGQAALVANFNTLPKDMGRDGREIAEKLGFVFGEDADEIFVNVTPPAGWSLSATTHSMHNDLQDPSGVKRAGIFYKAAFYDRRANLNWHCRYTMGNEYPSSRDDRSVTAVVRDNQTGETLWSQHTPNDGGDDRAFYAQQNVADNAARDWLGAQFPEHRNPLAYWSITAQ